MNLTSLNVLEEAVSTGAAYLDGRYPGWRWRIDPEIMDATCEVHSVTGQLFGPMVSDQMRGVGIDYESEPIWVVAQRFVDMGFAVLVNDPVAVPEAVLAEMAQLGVSLPAFLPVPRDRDVTLAEAATLQLLWEREVAKR